MGAAALIYVGLIVALSTLGLEQIRTAVAVLAVMLFLLAVVRAGFSTAHNVLIARTTRAWDDLLLTSLSNRDLITGQILATLRPVLVLIVLTLPVALVLIVGIVVAQSKAGGLTLDLLHLISLVCIIFCYYALMGVFVYCFAIIGFYSALSARRAMHAYAVVLGSMLLLSVLLLVLPVSLFIFVPVCWYLHRLMNCTLRHKLQQMSGS